MRRSALAVVCLAVFVDMLGFGIILPSLPLRAQQLGGSGAWVGALLTAYALAQLVAAPILGSLSDRYGRRRLLLLSLVGSMVSLALTGVAGSLALLLLARVVAGACGGAIAVGQAYAVDLADQQRRTQALGMVGASIGLGFVIGPAIGAGLAAGGLGFTGTCLVAAALAGANVVAGLFLLPTTVPTRQPEKRQPAGARSSLLRVAVDHPALRVPLIAMFAVTFAFTSMETTFALLGADRFGLGPAGLGLVFTWVGVVLVVIQGGVVGRLTDRYGHRRVAVTGAVLLGVGLAAVPFVPAWLAYLALGVAGAGQGLLATSLAALIADSGGSALGGMLGLGQSTGAAARATAPILAGLAYDVGAPVPYLVATVTALAAALLLRTGRSTPVADGPTTDTAQAPLISQRRSDDDQPATDHDERPERHGEGAITP